MDQQQEVTNQPQEDQQQEQQEQKPQMNGKTHNNNHSAANGKCTEENAAAKPNGNGIHSADSVESALLPHLESIERLMKLPVVEATWHQSQDVYGKVKGNHFVHNFIISRTLGWHSSPVLRSCELVFGIIINSTV